MTHSSSTRYPSFGVPPARQPRPASNEPTLWGKRAVLSTPEGFVYDMRMIGEIYRDADGRDAVDIITEEDYYPLDVPPRAAAGPAVPGSPGLGGQNLGDHLLEC